jgi:tetratricopeptide (TPR) repeat protein
MSSETRILPARSIVAALLLVRPLMAVAQPADADFQQAVAAYQQSPSDATREKVIRMAAAMDQPPPIPAAAWRAFVRGQTAFKDAASTSDFVIVSQLFGQAVRLAPWWPEARYNWALAFEAAGDYPAAIDNLQAYLMFKLPEAEARAAQDKIADLEAKPKMAEQEKKLTDAKARESSPETNAAMKPNEFEDWLRKLEGRRYVYPIIHEADDHLPRRRGFFMTLTVRGKFLVGGTIAPPGERDTPAGYQENTTPTCEIRGRESSVTWEDPVSHAMMTATFIISENGDSITKKNQFPDGSVFGIPATYAWQR